MHVVAEDSHGQRVPAAVGDRLSDHRVVHHHPERHRQAGESQNTQEELLLLVVKWIYRCIKIVSKYTIMFSTACY